MTRRLAILTLVTLTACTPREIDGWLTWHATDPAAAIAFLDTLPPEPAVTNTSRWDRIARCESGGNWNHPPVTNRTGTYTGGLMIWTRAWTAYGGTQYAPQAWLATKAQQINIAERIWTDRGPRAWDCA